MNLRNKKTGETGYYLHTHRDYKTGVLKIAVLKDGVPFSEFKPYEPIYDYDSLAELSKEWEDYKEPNNPCFINWFGEVSELLGHISDREIEKLKEAGNYFETKEEAEKAVEELKAWKRLKDKGFRFGGYELVDGTIRFMIDLRPLTPDDLFPDLDLLFGGEE